MKETNKRQNIQLSNKPNKNRLTFVNKHFTILNENTSNSHFKGEILFLYFTNVEMSMKKQ